jgi:CarD family transcriptional regulator
VELERFGERRMYLKLRLPHGLTLMVPVESTEQVGLRGVVSRDELDEVFDLLRGDEGRTPVLWGKRYRANLAKLISGEHLPRGRGRPEPLP